jgi:hypothetical protein
MARGKAMNWVRGVMSTVLFGMSIVLVPPALAQRTNTTVVKPEPVGSTTPIPSPATSKPLTPAPVNGNVSPLPPKPSSTPPPPPPPPKPPLPPALRETPNNPLAAPQNIDDLLRLRMTEDLWLEAKISTVNQKIEEAKTNNKKSIDLSIFEPALQLFLKQETVVENGQTRKIGFIERVGQIFTNPGSTLNDVLSAIGIPILRGSYGGNDAQQSRAIQISDLVVKVAEMERIKTEVGAKTREKIQQLMLEFDILAREFQAEQAIATSESKSFKLYSVTYAAGDGDTNIYLNRKGQLDKTKLQVFKYWARVRGQITAIKTVVMPRDTG